MNGNRPMEVHYINTGFPYSVTESFMDLFEGLTYAQADVALAEALQDQGNPYWPMMHAGSYKYSFTPSGSSSYYSFSHLYDIHDYIHRSDGGRRVWDNPAALSTVDAPQVVVHSGEGPNNSTTSRTEECIRVPQNTTSSQVIWQDNIDPDNMTYELNSLHVKDQYEAYFLLCRPPWVSIIHRLNTEELLDLGEAVGSQSRGLSQERISMLPVSKYKCSLFSRKKNRRERCVICQMEYKRGDRQMTLPCKHVYHAGCVARWLIINKACPVCFAEVVVEESQRQ
ncbi:E3 ubiquitin ligase BIG BROTHER-like isoform X1 [Ananas comosus]|uniref:E3 ubiquitin ligase BIG BROTHER-like isoform X1 n=1 Tax=Ananas comosus TaxID=4615 RepID=A0A6P5G935_ANACO|nr:E3 ubiquitin ligase BIG BROTHER-like isoform X1 [Ananas comosus]